MKTLIQTRPNCHRRRRICGRFVDRWRNHCADRRATLMPALADQVIDASGLYVLPGGVDVHTHLDMEWRGTRSCDDFYTGHRAALFGGTTTHVDFSMQPRDGSCSDAIRTWHGKANGKALIDYGFHVAITDLTDTVMAEIAELPSRV